MLDIPTLLLDKIREHARLTYPEECCGLLLGKTKGLDKSVLHIIATDNAYKESLCSRYCISPLNLLEAENSARNLGFEIIGVYHSHPNRPASPSEFDQECALPWYSYIILSINNEECGDLTSWVLRDERSCLENEYLYVVSQYPA